MPFGEIWYQTASPGWTSKWKFTSYERDAESGNDYAMFRTYVNRLGRFSGPDPIGGFASDPQSLNRYAYVRNDPAGSVDALGLLVHPRRALLWNSDGILVGGSDDWGACLLDGSTVDCALVAGLVETGSAAILPPGMSTSGFINGNFYRLTFTDDDEGIGVSYPGLTDAQVESLGLPTSMGKGGNDLVERLKDTILKNPKCYGLFSKNPGIAKNILAKFNGVVDISGPSGPSASKEELQARAELDRLGAIAITAVPTIPNYTPPTWSGRPFTTYAGQKFMQMTGPQQLTVLIHEMLHVARADVPLTRTETKEHNDKIRAACGTQ